MTPKNDGRVHYEWEENRWREARAGLDDARRLLAGIMGRGYASLDLNVACAAVEQNLGVRDVFDSLTAAIATVNETLDALDQRAFFDLGEVLRDLDRHDAVTDAIDLERYAGRPVPQWLVDATSL